MQTPGARRAEDIAAAIPLRRRLAYAALLLAFALGLAELVMRAVVGWKGDWPPTPDESLEYEWEWAARHLAVGSAARDPDSRHEYDPDLGWRLVPGQRGEVTTNSRGLRSDREYALGRQPGRRRLALLGDSFTYGAHVADDVTFGWLLERELLSGWDVLNFAVSGYGTDQAQLAWELRGVDLAADVVVMGFYVRDYERNTMNFKIYAKPVFVPEGEGLRLTGHPVIAPEALYQEYVSGRRGVGRVRAPFLALSVARAWRNLHERWPSASDAEWQVLSRLMRRFRDRVTGAGARPVWLVLPYHDVVETSRSSQAAIEELCEQEAARLGLPLLRVDEAFRAHAARHPDRPLFRPREIGGHFSAEGHRLVAEILAAELREAAPPAAGDR
jgi:lysophospholipase L1-like esterase